MKPILLELIPVAVVGFVWLALKNMDKPGATNGRVAMLIGRIKWETWIFTVVVALVLAAVITKAFL